MIRILSSFLLLAGSAAWLGAAVPVPIPKGEKITEVKNQNAYAVEQKTSQTPLRIEQDCPAPEIVDITKSSSWNTLEVGLSLPLGEGWGEAIPYSRYTCDAIKSPPE